MTAENQVIAVRKINIKDRNHALARYREYDTIAKNATTPEDKAKAENQRQYWAGRLGSSQKIYSFFTGK